MTLPRSLKHRLKAARKKSASGFTLLELITVLAILGVIVTLVTPNVSQFGDSQRLIGAAEQVYGHLQQARSESVAGNTQGFVNFAVDGTNSWEYGMSSANSLCDLSITAAATADACVIVVNDGDANIDPGDGSVDTGDLVLMRFTDFDFTDVKMSIADFTSGNTQFQFDPVRGTSTSGRVNLESGEGKRLSVKVSILGRVTICSPDGSINNYSSTGC